MIIITNSRAVLVDGVNFGAVADTIANNPKLASEVQIALENYEAELLAKHTTEKNELSAIHAESLAAKDDALIEADIERKELKIELQALRTGVLTATDLDSLKAAANLDAKGRRLAEIAEQKAALDKEASELSAASKRK